MQIGDIYFLKVVHALFRSLYLVYFTSQMHNVNCI